MNEDVILCQREIRRLRCVVRTYEAQIQELENYLRQMAEDPLLGDEAKRTIRELYETWRRILEN
jgi:hypothetical protein